MRDFGSVIHRADGSFVINNGLFHVPDSGDFHELYLDVSAYVLEHPDRVIPDASPQPTLEESKALKRERIDLETSASILAGFEYSAGGHELHFSYGALDQQNFADSANAATLAVMGVPGVPQSVTWNGYRQDGSMARIAFNAQEFLAFYMGGALAHKAACMERGGARKAAVEAARTVAEVEAA